MVDAFWRVGSRCALITYNAEWRMWVKSGVKHVCLLWTNSVACHTSKQRMLGPSSCSHTPSPQLCTMRGFRMEQNRILALRIEVSIKGVISVTARLLYLPYRKSDSEGRSVLSDFLQPHGLYCPWNSPGQNTAVGSLSLLQGIFPIQGSNPHLPHCRQILYQLSHKGAKIINLRVFFPFN